MHDRRTYYRSLSKDCRLSPLPWGLYELEEDVEKSKSLSTAYIPRSREVEHMTRFMVVLDLQIIRAETSTFPASPHLETG